MRSTRGALAALIGSAALVAAGPARADTPEPPDERRDTYSAYERNTIDQGVSKLGAAVDPAPAGKILEGVDVITLDVFEKRDPLPWFLTPIANFFHATTRHYVIEREVLLAPGARWDQALVDETARNLRGLPQLSLVLTVALRGSAPDRVRLLVITKDVWSLRLNSNYTFENGRLQYLLLQPSEENLIGSQQAVYGNIVLDPATLSLGGSYVIPRLAGSRIATTVGGSAILNRATGAAEGSYGSFSYGQPLYATLTKWAWGGAMGWNYAISRRFLGGEFTAFDAKSGTCVPIGAGVAPDGPGSCRYRSDQVNGSFFVTRSWGSAHKHDLTLAFTANRNEYSPFDSSFFTPTERAAFAATLMPVSDTQIGPYLQFHDYSSRFIDVHDVETLALTENFRRGHELILQVQPVSTALRSTRSFVDLFAAFAYTVPLGDGFVRGLVQANTEISTDSAPPPAQGRIPDASVEAALRIVTPRFGAGRLVFDTHVLDRYHDYINGLSSLGGDTRLRGYPSGAFIGKDFFAANAEYRSRPFELFSVDFAGTAFYDVGDAFNDFSKVLLKHSVGVGARIEFPQLERSVMRFDWGFPLTPAPGLPSTTRAFPGDVTLTFGQAFGIPVIPTGN